MKCRRKNGARSMRLEALEARNLLTALIALVDTGVELNGPYRPYYDLANAYNAQTDQFASVSGEAVVRDTHGHGRVLTNQTMLGVLDAMNQAGATGADVKILPISYRNPSTGATSYAAILRGIRHAADLGAAVINVSLGENWNFSAPGIGTISQAVQYAEGRGSVVIAPAGNRGFQNQAQGINVDRSAESAIFPAFTDDPAYNRLGTSLSNLLVTAAVNPSGNLTAVSNWGPTHVDVGSFSNSEGVTSYAAGYASGVTGVIAALTPGWGAGQRVQHMKQTVNPHPQPVGSWSTTGGNISAANAVEALHLESTVDDVNGSGAGYSRSGAWTSYAGLGYAGDHSAALGAGAAATSSATATWTFTGLTPGRYRVLGTWVPANNRATDAPFSVGDAGTTPEVVRVDQTDQASARPVDAYAGGLPWWVLGGPGHSFSLAGSELVVQLGNNVAVGKFVIADGIRIERLGDLPPTVDDVDGSSGGYTRSGAWTSYAGLGYAGDHSAARGVGAAATATASSTWTFSGLAPGRYRVLGTWVPADNRATDAPFAVGEGDAAEVVRVDQTSARPVDVYAGGLPWWDLGGPGSSFRVAGSQLVVQLANNVAVGRYVVADAIRIERLGAL